MTGPPPTPYFVVRERDLRRNLERIASVKEASGARVVLALKCFSTWGVFDIMRPYLDGTTGSSPYEARLGHEEFGGETHVYGVAFSDDDVRAVAPIADKVVFNSLGQLRRHAELLRDGHGVSVGLRLNPEVSYARQRLADPGRAHSRLGVPHRLLPPPGELGIDGALVHVNCENPDFGAFAGIVDEVSARFGDHLDDMTWVSLGGGVAFTSDGYPLEAFARRVRDFGDRHGVQVYLEPGEAVVTRTTDLVVTVLDVVDNGMPTAIVDSATEAHRLDTLTFDEPARVGESVEHGAHQYVIASRSCLAGDVFCTARFDRPLEPGDRLHVLDSGGYTMVKLNWFNGLRMPAVYCEREDGSLEPVHEAGYDDYKRALSQRRVGG